MSNVDQAFESQIKNIQTRTGKSMEELHAMLKKSGLAKHGELRDYLKREMAMGHGDANTVVHLYLNAVPESGSPEPPAGDVLDEIYAGPKAHLRPIHERFMAALNAFGPFEIAPKKGYVSLRRKKQFAMIGPATKTRVEVGLNLKGVEATSRLAALPPGGMCQYKVNLTNPEEVDAELLSWVRRAFDAAGAM